MNPAVSILIDTYNHERYIEQAVISAVEQDFPSSDYEILVVDDGSTDRTPEIVRKFAPRVRLLKKTNGGQASAFNAAFPELRGEIVALLDGDDWFAPGKLSAVMKVLSSDPDIASVGHGYYEHHDDTNERIVRAPDGPKLLNLSTPQHAREALYGWPFLLTSALTVRRDLLRRVIPIPEELVFCADTPIILGSMAGGACLLEEPLCYYRLHAQNLCTVTGTDSRRLRRRHEVLERTFELMVPLLRRLGVSPEATTAILYRDWVVVSRFNLATFGGTRLHTFQTELRHFEFTASNPTLAYRLFKYLFVGAATLALPPRLFYRARDWYARKNLGRFREQLARSR